MPARKQLGTRTYRNFSDETLERAVKAVKCGKSLRTASQEFGIPRATINRHVRQVKTGKIGRPTVLSPEEEEKVTQRIALAGDWGFPLTKFDIRLVVKAFLDRQGKTERRFNNNMPGKDWVDEFLRRQKRNLTQRLGQNVKRARARVDRASINAYFDNLEVTLANVEPRCIINYDETNITDDPKRKKVIVRRKCRHPELIVDSSKSSVSVMFTAAGDGTVLPPYVTYKSKHLYESWTQGGPDGTAYNRTNSGWFTMEIFEDWYFKVALPYIFRLPNNLKKVLIGDNLASHVSAAVVESCEENNISFVLLPPNSTGITQPLDVSYFKPLKVKWSEVLFKWKSKNRGTVPKDKFPVLLKQCLKEMEPKSAANVLAGFRGCGYVPLDREQVLKRLPAESTGTTPQRTSDNSNSDWNVSFETFLSDFRKKETNPTRQVRKKINLPAGQGITTSLLANLKQTPPVSGHSTPKRKGKEMVSSSETRKAITKPKRRRIVTSSDSDYSLHDTEDSLSEDELIDIRCSEEDGIEGDCVLEGTFVVVRLIYNQNSHKKMEKFFYGKVMEVGTGKITVHFMRESSKAHGIYIFPQTSDILDVDPWQIVKSVKVIYSSRGRYRFE